LVAGAAEHRGTASRAEKTPGIVGGLAGDGHRFGREDRKGVEHRAVMLSAIQTMADADTARFNAALQSYRPAEAASGIVGFAHVRSPDCPSPRMSLIVAGFQVLLRRARHGGRRPPAPAPRAASCTAEPACRSTVSVVVSP